MCLFVLVFFSGFLSFVVLGYSKVLLLLSFFFRSGRFDSFLWFFCSIVFLGRTSGVGLSQGGTSRKAMARCITSKKCSAKLLALFFSQLSETLKEIMFLFD